MEEFEEICFGIITNVGTARSEYIEAVHLAKEGDFEGAELKIQEGKKFFLEGHRIHAELITREAAGDTVKTGLILLHAEDQLMSAEAFSILANEFIDVYKKINGEALE